MQKLLYSLLFFIIAGSSAYSQWVIRENWGGEPVYDLKENDGMLFATTYGGLYRSSNHGINWSKVQSIGPGIAFYEVEITESGTIYCVSLTAKHELKRSRDGGLSWEKIPAPAGQLPYVYRNSGMAVVGNFLFIHNGQQVLRLSETDDVWHPLQNLPFSGDLYQIEVFEGMLWVGTQAGVAFRSADAGQSWEQITAGAPYLAVRGNIVLNYADPIYQNTYITRSNDGGQTWAPVTMPEIIKSIRTSDSYFWALTYSNEVLRSADGQSWSSINTRVDPEYWSGGREINGTLYLPGELGIRRSSNDGGQWWATNTGIGGNVYPIQSIGSTLISGKRNFSDNAGETWQTMVKPGGFGHIYSFDDRIYINYEATRWKSISSDLTQWELLPPSTGLNLELTEGIFKAGDCLFCVSNNFADRGKVFRSCDEGATWEHISTAVSNNDFDLLGAVGDSTVFGRAYTNTGSELLISYNLGLSWQLWDIAPVIGYHNYDFRVYGKRIYTLRGLDTQPRDLMVSEDYGSTWRNLTGHIQPAGGYGLYDLAVTDTLLFVYTLNWQGAARALWVSRDTGDSWTNLLAHPDFSEVSVTSLGTSTEHVYFVNQTDGKLWIRPLAKLFENSQAGTVFWDFNNDGIRQSGEAGVRYCGIKTTNPVAYAAIANNKGDFLLDLILPGDTVRPVVPPLPYAQSAPAFRIGETGNPPMEFAIQRPGGIHDLRLEALPATEFLAGRNTDVHFFLNNDGTENGLCGIEVIFNENLTIEGTTPPYTSLTGNRLYWFIDHIPPLAQRQLICNFKSAVGNNEVLNAGLTARAIVLNDTTPLNNADTLYQEILNSFDPNDKQVDRPRITPLEASQLPELRYTIRFQNTGSYPAFQVRLLDTISPLLDASSLRLLGASHPYNVRLTENRILEFIFDEIYLPDSTRDEPGSHGFVFFSLRPGRVLHTGEVVPNTAHIFFDFNTPITTNTATTEVILPLSTPMQTAPETLRVFPNPGSGDFFVSLPEGLNGATFLDVFSLDGRLCNRFPTDGRSARIDLSAQKPGLFLLRWGLKEGGWRFGKVILSGGVR
jgi:photosystem II stability/assembly factor-like uncharacterized protein